MTVETTTNVEVSAYSLTVGDMVTDGTGQVHEVIERDTVLDTWDSRSLVWIRCSTVQGLTPGAIRTFRYELDDVVLTVKTTPASARSSAFYDLETSLNS